MTNSGKRWTVQDVAIALFGFDVNDRGETIPNNFVATAFFKHIRPKGGKA